MKKIINIIKIGILSCIFSFYVFMIPVYSFSPSSTNIYEGIDVSNWQGNINFAEVKSDGIQVVYIKASEGANYIDPFFEQNYQGAKENGLLIGVYHYLTATSVEEARVQANFFGSVISGKNLDCKLAMDFESFGNLNIDEINQISLVFLEQIQAITGKEPVVYSDTFNATNTFGSQVANYPLWVAQYGVSEPTENGKWDTWVGFQFTDEGVVAGIDGFVDRDKFTDGIFLSDNSQLPNIERPQVDNLELGTTRIVIQPGDTLSEIAIMYNTTVARLVELNSIANPNLIFAGETLLVPTSSKTQVSDNAIYIVKRGDTLTSIAQKFGVSINSIISINNISNPNLIFVGQRLKIPRNSIEITNDTSHLLYRVRRGDTLYAISRRYNTSIANIVRVNRIANPNLIFPGELLRI